MLERIENILRAASALYRKLADFVEDGEETVLALGVGCGVLIAAGVILLVLI
jgi:hypothetical protein